MSATSGSRDVSTFTVGTLHLGVDVLRVQEVIRLQHMTPVPLAPPAVRGLMNLRGEIATAIDLARRLHLPTPLAAAPVSVVIRTDEGPVSLLVDEVSDVITVAEETLLPVPHTITGPARELATAVCYLSDRLLLLLDVDKTIDVAADGDSLEEGL